MYFYSVSTGCYSDIQETMLQHKKKFKVSEFNEIVTNICKRINAGDRFFSDNDRICDTLEKEFGFERLEYINCHAYDYSFGYKDSMPQSSTINRRK